MSRSAHCSSFLVPSCSVFSQSQFSICPSTFFPAVLVILLHLSLLSLLLSLSLGVSVAVVSHFLPHSSDLLSLLPPSSTVSFSLFLSLTFDSRCFVFILVDSLLSVFVLSVSFALTSISLLFPISVVGPSFHLFLLPFGFVLFCLSPRCTFLFFPLSLCSKSHSPLSLLFLCHSFRGGRKRKNACHVEETQTCTQTHKQCKTSIQSDREKDDLHSNYYNRRKRKKGM